LALNIRLRKGKIMEKNDIKLPIPDESIIRDNHVPTPPTGDVWKDKERDHDFFQKNVSLAAQLGGVSASAGCLTESAERARQAAEQRYYSSQKIPLEKIIEKKKIKIE